MKTHFITNTKNLSNEITIRINKTPYTGKNPEHEWGKSYYQGCIVINLKTGEILIDVAEELRNKLKIIKGYNNNA